MTREELIDMIIDHSTGATDNIADGVWYKSLADAILEKLPLPPAEGAEQIASDLSLTIGLLEAEIDSLKDAYKSDGLNSREYSSAILSHKTALKILKGNTPPRNQQQPTAEGAEEILEEYISYDIQYPFPYVKPALALKAMHEFATLHAQRIAEKMVSERLKDKLVKCLNWVDKSTYWKEDNDIPTTLIVDEYLKTRDNHD